LFINTFSILYKNPRKAYNMPKMIKLLYEQLPEYRKVETDL